MTNKIQQQIRKSDKEFSLIVNENLNELTIEKWKDGGDFEEIKDLEYCNSNIDELFAKHQKQLIEVVIEEVDRLNLTMDCTRKTKSKSLDKLKSLLEESIK